MVQLLKHQAYLWDTRLFLRVFGGAGRKAWRRFFYGLSRSADTLSCAAIGLAWFVLQPSQAPYLLAGLAAFAIELSLYYFLKNKIKRPRQFRKLGSVQCLIVPPDEFSFPSGHTAAAFLMAALLTAAMPVLAVPLFLWALGVGFSRVYLGVHYPGDVLAGMGLGLLSAQAGLWALHWFI